MQGSAPTQVIEAVCEMLVTLRGPYVGRIDHDIASRLSRTFDIDAELWIRIDENFFGQAIDRARGAQQ
jgi:hypothetical protein